MSSGTRQKNSEQNGFDRIELITIRISRWASSSAGFIFAFALQAAWLFLFAIGGLNPEWDSFIERVIISIAFILLFIMARTQSKETAASQIKLNELIAVLNGANNTLINVESLSEHKIHELAKLYETISRHMHSVQKTDIVKTAIITEEILEEITERGENEEKPG